MSHHKCPTTEDVILRRDRRGMAALRPYLPPDYCAHAARFVLDNPGDAVIVTGFYILSAGAHETDGPPGALAIGAALEKLGRRVTYVSDRHTTPFLMNWLNDPDKVVTFPIAEFPASWRAADEALERLKPGLVVSIERCGPTEDNRYLNMRGRDVTPYTARLDCLFHQGLPSVGIGDGGNEIGMGNLAAVIPAAAPTLPPHPAVTKVDRLIIASVSNWGGYGLVAALSQLTGQNLLPTPEHEARVIRYLVDSGAVDGTSGAGEYLVDGFTVEENSAVLRELASLIERG